MLQGADAEWTLESGGSDFRLEQIQEAHIDCAVPEMGLLRRLVLGRLADNDRVNAVERDCEQHPKNRGEEQTANDLAHAMGPEKAGRGDVSGSRIIEAFVFLPKGRERW